MRNFATMASLEAACADLPEPDRDSAEMARARQAQLTKPAGSLGRLEELAVWLASWQGRPIPRIDDVDILVFAGNHGVVAQGVSAYPPAVTGQMVGNFLSGGAAIYQLARLGEARLRIIPLGLETPTGDVTEADAMDVDGFLDAVSQGFDTLEGGCDLACLGEMGIGNTTIASCQAAALFGGTGADWVGTGTGVDAAGLARKARAVDAALARVGLGGRAIGAPAAMSPLEIARTLGGRELAALLGAALGARHRGVPVLVDGFVSTASVAPLGGGDGLAHARLAHVSAERGHRRLAARLGLEPLLDLGMRLGEGSGAAVALLVARAAVACHGGMATFDQAGVATKARGSAP